MSASPRTSSRNAPNAMPRSWRSLSESGGSCSSGKYAPLPERGCSASCGFATAKLTTASERESGTRSSRIETPACLMRTISRAAATCCAAESDAHLGSSRSPSMIAGSTKLPAGSGTSPTLIFAPTSRTTGVIVSKGKQAVSCDVRSTRALARGDHSCGACDASGSGCDCPMSPSPKTPNFNSSKPKASCAIGLMRSTRCVTKCEYSCAKRSSHKTAPTKLRASGPMSRLSSAHQRY